MFPWNGGDCAHSELQVCTACLAFRMYPGNHSKKQINSNPFTPLSVQTLSFPQCAASSTSQGTLSHVFSPKRLLLAIHVTPVLLLCIPPIWFPTSSCGCASEAATHHIVSCHSEPDPHNSCTIPTRRGRGYPSRMLDFHA